jgi:hypothetical protein
MYLAGGWGAEPDYFSDQNGHQESRALTMAGFKVVFELLGAEFYFPCCCSRLRFTEPMLPMRLASKGQMTFTTMTLVAQI